MPKKKETTFADITGEIKDFELNRPEMKELIAQFTEEFGGFSRKELNQFYEKYGVARVIWKQKKIDGEMNEFPFGKIVAAIEIPGKSGTKAFKEHKYFSDIPFEFWERAYNQCHRYIAQMEYAERQSLLQLAETI